MSPVESDALVIKLGWTKGLLVQIMQQKIPERF